MKINLNKSRLLLVLLVPIFIQAQQSPVVKEQIVSVLDQWHKAASDANFDAYFKLMDQQSIFIGTDPEELWNKQEFMDFAKPYFDRGKAWSFTSVERNIYMDQNQKYAWFDELLSTQMELCRGSGILMLTDQGWKIRHYVLSIAVPNEDVDQLVALKKEHDQSLIDALRKK
ncbi:MAG: nuclear transport factor 2 family protein [Flavobacteriaceae bacterium]